MLKSENRLYAKAFLLNFELSYHIFSNMRAFYTCALECHFLGPQGGAQQAEIIGL